jgi:hypothetical protein
MLENFQYRTVIIWCSILSLFVYSLYNSNIIQLPNKFYSNTSSIKSTELALERFTFEPPSNDTPKEAFVTFCNNNPKYLALLTTVLDSIHEFSTRPIIAYGIDVDLNIDNTKYPRLIKRRLKQTDCGPSIYFCKIAAIVYSQVDYGIYVEADTIVNWNVDILFDVLHQWPYSLPLAPRHPDDPGNYRPFLKKFKMDFQNRTTPYIHAHMLWNYRSYPFLQRALNLLRQGYFNGANYDETGINILLWEAKANHTLCKFDPYYTFLPAYESNQQKCVKYCHTAYIFIHGSKSAIAMRDILNRLKKYAGSPFIQTPSNGMHYLNETQYTCCYPDSRQSKIHPLLCEHN